MLDYLEGQLPAEGFLFGTLGLADISISAFLRNAAFARYKVDAIRWPRTAGFVDRVLAAAGAAISEETVGGAVPRRGVMRPRGSGSLQ